jgi:xanthine phosphoribosyltransferase
VNKLKLNFLETQNLIGKICRDISVDGWKPDYVVGITRGGLLPAVMISHYFNVPCETLKVSLRDGGDTESKTWMAEDAFGFVGDGTGTIADPAFRKNILIVDDINDSGATIDWIINDWRASCMPNSPIWNVVWGNTTRFAVVVDNLASKCQIKMNYVGTEVNKAENDVWVDFPYEEWWTK